MHTKKKMIANLGRYYDFKSVAYSLPGIKQEFKELSIQEVSQLVCDYFNLDLSIVTKKGRKAKISYCRHLIFYLLRVNTREAYKNIGRFFGRDHTTVIYGVQLVTSQIRAKHDNDYKDDIVNLQNLIDNQK